VSRESAQLKFHLLQTETVTRPKTNAGTRTRTTTGTILPMQESWSLRDVAQQRLHGRRI
jgi:hypothetical protein